MSKDPDETRRKRGRRWTILGILLAALILLALLLPAIAAPFVKGKVEDALEDQLAVDASIQDLSFTLGGSLALSGLRLVDPAGRPVLELEALDASVGVLRAIVGTYAFDADARGLVVHLYEEDDGSWSVEDLPRAKEPKPPREEKERGALELFGSARLSDAAVVLTRRDGTAVRADLAASAAFDGPERPAKLEGTLALSTGGRALLAAEIPGDPGRVEDLARLSAAASLRFDPPIDLGALGQALGELAPADVRGGRLSGSGDLRLGPALDLALSAGFAVEDLVVQGPRAGAPPLSLARVTLDASTAPAGAGALAPRVALRADDALELALEGTLRGAGEPDARLDATLRADGDAGALARLAEGWTSLREGLALEGRLAGTGAVEVALADDALASASGELSLALEGLSARDAQQREVDLGELGAPRLELAARYDAAGAALELESLALTAGPVRATADGQVAALDAPSPRLERARLDLYADLDALARSLEGLVDLGERRPAGSLEAHVQATGEGGRLPFDATFAARGLALGAADAADAGDATGALRGLLDADQGALRVDELALAMPGLAVRGTADVRGLDRADGPPDATVDVAIDAEPSELPAWALAALGPAARAGGAGVALRVQGGIEQGLLDLALGLTGRDVALSTPDGLALALGSVRADLRARGPLEEVALTGDGELLMLDLALPPAQAADGAAPAKGIAIQEPRVTFALDVGAGAERGDLDLRRVHVESQALTGDVTGRVAGLRTLLDAEAAPDVAIEALHGDLVYVPDRLAAALGPLIPGELTGAAPEPLAFRLDGRLRGRDAAAAVAGLAGSIDAGVGRYVQAGLDVGGRAHVELKDGRASLTSTLRANGGELAVSGELAVEAGADGLVAQDPTLKVGAEDVAANASMGPLLGFVHPAFAGLDALAQNQLGGLIDCDVDLRYEGALDLRALAAGWDALPKEPIQGSVTFGLEGGMLAGSPLVQSLLSKLDLGGTRDFALEPVRLDVQDGRVSYASPWEWTVAGAVTSFAGSIGLDQTLDLEWSIPITAEVVARNDFLKSLQGQTIRIPLSGTITRPKLETDALFSSLVKDTVKTGIQDVLKGKSDVEGEDAGSLLKRADELWDQGDKAAAAPLYRRIEKEYKLSLVYLTNKSRIKDRADWKP